MTCKTCYSKNLGQFNGEVANHFPGLKGLDKPIVWAFPKLLVCLDCGIAQFAVPEEELRVLTQNETAVTNVIAPTLWSDPSNL